MYDIEHLPATIYIGFTGEMNLRTVQFDMTAWMEEMPDGVPRIIHIKPGESEADAYPVEISFIDNILTWTVTQSDLGQVEGAGVAQIWLEEMDNQSGVLNVVKRSKSAIVSTIIYKAIDDPNEEPPSSQKSWFEKILLAAENSEAFGAGTRNGVNVESDDPAYHNNAEYYSEQAREDSQVAYEQRKEAIDEWMDNHPEETTTVQDGSLTKEKFTNVLKNETVKDYVTPQMFGAVADALYYDDNAWYKDAEHQDRATDNKQAFQDAIDSGYPVLVPIGSYYLSGPINIHRTGTTIRGCGISDTDTILHFHETNAIVVSSGYNLISIKNLCLHNDIFTNAGIEVSYQSNSLEGSVHFLTVDTMLMINFKYGICVAGYSETEQKDNYTFLWNCSFRDIKCNTFSSSDCCGVRFFANSSSHFGIEFDRLIVTGYKTVITCSALKGTFNVCNFGINDVNAIIFDTVSDVIFTKCNFECDTKVLGAINTYLMQFTTKCVFVECGFVLDTNSNTACISGGVSSEFVFIGNRNNPKTGNEMTDFFFVGLMSGKYSVIFAGGNSSMPRPLTNHRSKIQLLDLERSVLPLKQENATEGTEYTGEMQFDIAEKIGGRPVWYDGSSWKGSPRGEWVYLGEVASGSAKTYTIQTYTDRPRTSIMTVRGNNNTVYWVGILSMYRDSIITTVIPMYSNNCSVSFDNNVATITNNYSSMQFMYMSVLDLI